MGLDFAEYTVTTSVGERVAMVITPVVGTTIPLSAMPVRDGPPTMSATDQQILGEAQSRVPRVSLCIFRGTSENESAFWRFDPAMSDADAIRLATELLRGQILVYRQMVQAGVCLFLHVDWGHLEAAAHRRGCEILAAELEAKQRDRDEPDPIDTVDLWVLRNLTFFFSLGFDKVVESILPEKLALMEKRMDRIQRMASELP